MQRDLLIEWKDKSILVSSIVYLLAVVFICVQAFAFVEPDAWNALFWIVTFFTVLSFTYRSFDHEIGSRFAYHYHLAKPQVIITAKLFLNGMFAVLLTFLGYIAFSLFLGNELVKPWLFLGVSLLGGLGIGFTFTLTSALSARAGGNLVLASILSLPLILPLLTILVGLTEFCFTAQPTVSKLPQFLGLLILNIIILVLSSLLFPYLWRD